MSEMDGAGHRLGYKGKIAVAVGVLFALNVLYVVIGGIAIVTGFSGFEGSGWLELRSWYQYIGLIFILAWQVMVIIASVAISVKGYAYLEKAGLRRTVKGLAWFVCGIVVFVLGAGFLGFAKDIPSEVLNANGTLTIVDDSLGSKHYSLWEREGALTRRYVRGSSDPDDTDPNMTEAEYQWLKYQELKAETENKNVPAAEYADAVSENKAVPAVGNAYAVSENKDVSAVDNSDAVSGNKATGFDSADKQVEEKDLYSDVQYINDKINDGLVAIYARDFASQDGYKYETSWSAKGEAETIIYEDDDIVEFLRYDRLSDNEKCLLYVYYRSDKTDDGFYSPGDAKILDMYAYVIDTGEVIASGRTSWADIGSEEYVKATKE